MREKSRADIEATRTFRRNKREREKIDPSEPYTWVWSTSDGEEMRPARVRGLLGKKGEVSRPRAGQLVDEEGRRRKLEIIRARRTEKATRRQGGG